MAWYYGTYSCNHEGRINVIGPEKDRQWKIDRAFNGLCPECYHEKIAKERSAEIEKAQKEAKKMELPVLSGSEKQIAWAETIRVKMINDISNLQLRNEDAKAFILDKVIGTTESRWFIDNRDLSVRRLIETFRSECEEYLKNKDTKEVDAQAEQEAKAESTLKPENSNGIEVTISANDSKLVAKCERNEEARQIFKSLKLKWEDGAWRRTINEYSGSYHERAAELANKLLLSGFTIICYDKSVLELAKYATFEKECNYWIRTYDGIEKLYIKMYESNDRIYSAARKIKTAKWDNEHKAIAIDVSRYNEILNFASDIGMKVSRDAMKMIDTYKLNQSKIQTTNVNEPLEDMNRLDKILLGEAGVLDDLKD